MQPVGSAPLTWQARTAAGSDLGAGVFLCVLLHPVHTTLSGVEICVAPGVKSEHDFIVKYSAPGKRARTPQHVHLVVELYVKQAHDPQTTIALRDHLLRLYDRVVPVTAFPPSLQVFKAQDVTPFQVLDAVGEFSVEFMLVVSEMILIQEKTNYPAGSMTQRLYRDFGVKDRFAVISAATFRGGR